MAAADLVPHDVIQIVNLDPGERGIPHIMPGEPASRIVQPNGGPVRPGHRRDPLILLARGESSPKVWATYSLRVVHVNERNQLVRPAALVGRHG